MDAFIHLSGNVGGDVEFRNNKTATASFRLACTPRVLRNGQWGDGETTWFTVMCFRSLAEHTAASIGKGDPIMVYGKLRTQAWERDGQSFERLVLEAKSIGHDLNRGTSAFKKAERPPQVEDSNAEVGDLIDSVESQLNGTTATTEVRAA